MRTVRTLLMVGVILLISVGFACRHKKHPTLNIVEPPLAPPMLDHQWETILDASLLAGPSGNAKKLGEIKRGDYIKVLDTRDVEATGMQGESINMTWYKVAVELTGKIGWVNKDAVTLSKHSVHWSSDTREGDALAKQLFIDKIFFDKPIEHIRVWNRYHLVVAWSEKSIPLSQKTAKHLLRVLDSMSSEHCANPSPSSWSAICDKTWKRLGRWVLIAWDEKGLFRYFKAFRVATIQPF